MIKGSFKIEGSAHLMQALKKTPGMANVAAKQAIRQITADVKREASSWAPEDTGNLRKGMKIQPLKGSLLSEDGIKAEILAEAWSKGKGKPFNYAYWHHEVYPSVYGRKSYKNPSTMGTVPNFFERVVEDAQKEREYEKIIERYIKNKLKEAGW